MRIWILMVALGACLVMAAGAATKPGPFRSPRAVIAPPKRVASPPPAPITPMVSNDGLEGLHEVFLDPHISGTAEWSKALGMDYNGLKEFATARLKKIPGLKISSNRSMTMPRLMVQVQGHTVPGYGETDPPAATHMTVALMQPVFLVRPGPQGQPIQTSGMTYHFTAFSTGKASDVPARVKEKVGYLLDDFIQSYEKANPKR